MLFHIGTKILQSFVFFKCGDGKARPTSSRPRPRKAKTRLLWARFRQPPGPFFLAARIKKIIPKSGGHHRASMATPCVRATSFWGVRGGGRAGGNSYNSVLKDWFRARSIRWEHSLTIVILYIEPFGWRACMKPEPRGVALGLLIAGFALAVVLAIAQVRPADLEAPGLKFVSPGIARK